MQKRFVRWAWVTLVWIYLIFVVGSVVRMTDSGMGCPDWPKCFGQWIPPTDVSELPENYAEIYKEKYGYVDTTFNVFHTWTEYVNRLVGATGGLVAFGLLILSAIWTYRDRTKKSFLWLALLLNFLFGFEGWLGAKVVYSELLPIKITFHMLGGLALIAVMVVILRKARQHIEKVQIDRVVFWMIIGSMILTATQILLGTQVRQNMDVISAAMDHTGRDTWIDQLGTGYLVHRSFSWLLLIMNGWILYKTWVERVRLPGFYLFLTVLVIEIAAGVGMAFLGVPKGLQPAHLLLGSILFGVQLHLLLHIRLTKK